jgi:F0F1-type ATP synthase assembly protein I
MPKSGKENKRNDLLKYMGMATQLFVLLFLLLWLGKKLDAYLELEKPIFMLIFIMVGLGAYLYKVYKDAS